MKITAPPAGVSGTDRISFQVNWQNQSNIECYLEPVTVQLNYAPQAELRLEYEQDSDLTYVTAKIVRPGGQTITNYTGRVLFRSARGANLSDHYADFVNGIARTTVTSIQSSQPILDVISAEIVQVDPWYNNEINSVLNRRHTMDLLYEPPLLANTSCSIGDLEVAFIIDSSGSMARNEKRSCGFPSPKNSLRHSMHQKTLQLASIQEGTY